MVVSMFYLNIKTRRTHPVGVGFWWVPLGSPVPVPALPIPTYPHGFVNPWQTLLVILSYFCIAISVVVMDGITIRHPRCVMDGCKLLLATAWDQYCSEDRLYSNICVTEQIVIANKLTHENLVHQAVCWKFTWGVDNHDFNWKSDCNVHVLPILLMARAWYGYG